MPTAVKISDELFQKAKIKSRVFKRSIAGQVEYWAKIGQLVEENPDLPLPFIQDILVGREQIKAGQGTPYLLCLRGRKRNSKSGTSKRWIRR